MPLRIAFIGFRHGHIHSLYKLAAGREDVEVVAACEEDAATRAALADSGVTITHEDYGAMLNETRCDVMACGNYFGRRGFDLARALEHGLHVIGDKPLCTRIEELDAIETLARNGNLRVGCMLDLVDAAPFRTLRRLVVEGAIGEVHTVCFSGQHPLFFGTRPAWYFEEGKHGGTLNDLAIHAIDAIPWITGRRIVEVTAARAWNARLTECPSFQDGAQLMLRLDNDGGVIGDVSYLTPEGAGYTLPAYWRFGIHGSGGYLETSATAKTVAVFCKDVADAREEPFDPPRPGGYLDDFLQDLAGNPNPEGLHTERVLRSARQTLQIQAAADTRQFPRAI
ncbi:MAG: Gfo/Idh/MocA family oxidoreductase [Candidatus Hydrogenedentes bacterium]|nr:Gfo/Idh/MocA family oxidoreductase [Candidatus Hydrogenedentota bacterium]